MCVFLRFELSEFLPTSDTDGSSAWMVVEVQDLYTCFESERVVDMLDERNKSKLY